MHPFFPQSIQNLWGFFLSLFKVYAFPQPNQSLCFSPSYSQLMYIQSLCSPPPQSEQSLYFFPNHIQSLCFPPSIFKVYAPPFPLPPFYFWCTQKVIRTSVTKNKIQWKLIILNLDVNVSIWSACSLNCVKTLKLLLIFKCNLDFNKRSRG